MEQLYVTTNRDDLQNANMNNLSNLIARKTEKVSQMASTSRTQQDKTPTSPRTRKDSLGKTPIETGARRQKQLKSGHNFGMI